MAFAVFVICLFPPGCFDRLEYGVVDDFFPIDTFCCGYDCMYGPGLMAPQGSVCVKSLALRHRPLFGLYVRAAVIPLYNMGRRLSVCWLLQIVLFYVPHSVVAVGCWLLVVLLLVLLVLAPCSRLRILCSILAASAYQA